MTLHYLVRPGFLAGIVLVTAMLPSCVVSPAPPPYEGPYAGTVYVTAAPPPPQVEVVGVAPYPGYFWIGGYWGWIGGRYSWVPGRWEASRAGYRYVPHGWVREGGGYRFHPGRWEEESHGHR